MVQYRTARTADLAAIRSLNEASMADTYEEETWRYLLNDGLIWLAEDDGQLLGYLAMTLGRWPVAGPYVFSLAVASTARRRGIASALLEQAWETARSQGSLELHCRAGNTPAQALYTAAGFRLIARRQGQYDNGEVQYHYRRRS
jgi:ribosomal protein S18 acetylase RimI-like enzyme